MMVSHDLGGWNGREPLPGSGGSQFPPVSASASTWASEVPGSATARAWANDAARAWTPNEAGASPGGLLDPSTIEKIWDLAEDDPVCTFKP